MKSELKIVTSAPVYNTIDTRTPSTVTGIRGDRIYTELSPKWKQLGTSSSDGHSVLSKKFTTGRPFLTNVVSVCASAETQATFSLTEGVEEHWSAGPARHGSSPAAS